MINVLGVLVIENLTVIS